MPNSSEENWSVILGSMEKNSIVFEDVFLWLPTGFGKSICYETLPFVFNYKHSDGGTGGGCSVVLVVSPLVSLIMEAIAA